jgi:hypothetical protein
MHPTKTWAKNTKTCAADQYEYIEHNSVMNNSESWDEMTQFGDKVTKSSDIVTQSPDIVTQSPDNMTETGDKKTEDPRKGLDHQWKLGSPYSSQILLFRATKKDRFL